MNKNIYIPAFKYQLTDYLPWIDLCDAIVTIKDNGGKYGDYFIVKKESCKVDAKYAIFTKGENRVEEKNSVDIDSEPDEEYEINEVGAMRLVKALKGL